MKEVRRKKSEVTGGEATDDRMYEARSKKMAKYRVVCLESMGMLGVRIETQSTKRVWKRRLEGRWGRGAKRGDLKDGT